MTTLAKGITCMASCILIHMLLEAIDLGLASLATVRVATAMYIHHNNRPITTNNLPTHSPLQYPCSLPGLQGGGIEGRRAIDNWTCAFCRPWPWQHLVKAQGAYVPIRPTGCHRFTASVNSETGWPRASHDASGWLLGECPP